MKPPPFAYVAPETLDDATAALARYGDDGKVLAGGQSLIPLMNLRLARPSVLVDLQRVDGLAGIEADDTGCRISAMARHAQVRTDPGVVAMVPMLAYAEGFVGHTAIRNRGTLVGSIAHADPAAEGPLVAVAHEAELTLARSGESRVVRAGDFFAGPFMTVAEPDELVVDVRFPALPADMGWGFEQVARCHGDFAIVAVAVLVHREGDVCTGARVAAAGVADTPIRLTAAEEALAGQTLDRPTLDGLAETIRTSVEPPDDVHAPAAYRRQLAAVLAERALAGAWGSRTEPSTGASV